jgi:transcription elongation factor Elf1
VLFLRAGRRPMIATFVCNRCGGESDSCYVKGRSEQGFSYCCDTKGEWVLAEPIPSRTNTR